MTNLLPARSPNRLSALLLFATVAIAPFPFGSTNPASIAFLCVALGITSIVASPGNLRRGQLALLAMAAVIILGYALVLHEQLSAYPWFRRAAPHPVWQEAAKALASPLLPTVSIAHNQPFFALGAPLAAMLSAVCSLIICSDRDHARRLLQVIAWSGVVYAVLSIGLFLIDPTKVLWREKPAYFSVLTGTFINRNTAAVYFGSCSIVWLLLLSERIRRHFPHGSSSRTAMVRQLLTDAPRDVVVSFSMLLICLAAMFMTGSRAGVVLSLVALVVAFGLSIRRDLPRRSGLLVVIAAGGAVGLILLQVLGAGVSGRFDIQGLADGGRAETYRSVWKMITDHPWFGTGLGTFAWISPAYRSDNISLWGTWDRAHSTPLEIATDLGIPLALLVIAGWVVVLAVLIHGVRTRRRDVAVPIAAVSVALLALAHSSIDFSLQIPGYALVVFALVGAGLSQSFRSQSTVEHDSHKRRSARTAASKMAIPGQV